MSTSRAPRWRECIDIAAAKRRSLHFSARESSSAKRVFGHVNVSETPRSPMGALTTVIRMDVVMTPLSRSGT